MDTVSAFLPCRAGSQRILNKNTKRFANYQNGLLELKLNQLLQCKQISNVFLSTDDSKIIDYVATIDNPKLVLHKRLPYLSSSSVSNDALIQHAADLVQDKHILWTHVTSPFITSDLYSDMINQYFSNLSKSYD